MSTKFCVHCRTNQPAATFVEIRGRSGRRTGSLVNHKCAKCVELGKRPRRARDERGQQRSADTRGASSRRQQELKQNREQQLLNKRRESKA
jgi:hypothetical protein